LKKAAILLLYWVFAYFANSQTGHLNNYTISGQLSDSVNGQVLAYASLYIKELKRSALTDENGNFQINNIKKGNYTLQIAYLGYHPTNIRIKVEKDISLKIQLVNELNHLHEFIVMGQHDDNFISSKSVIKIENIERSRGQNFVDLLRSIAGVSSLNSGPGIAKPVIRGLHSNRVVTLNNDIRLEDQQWGADHGPEVDPFSIGKVEVIKGASGLQYGAEAIGGVVKLASREYLKNKGIQGEWMANGFSNNRQLSSSMLLEGNHLKSQALKWRSQASYTKAGDAQTADYVMNNTGFNELNLSTALQYEFKKLNMEASQSFYRSEIGILKSSHIHNQTDLLRVINNGSPLVVSPYSYNIGRPKQEVNHQVYALKLSYQFAKSKLSYALSQQINNRKEYDVLVSWNNNNVNQNSAAYDLTLTSWQNDLKFETQTQHNLSYSIGASWMYQGNYATGKQFFIPNFIANTYGAYAVSKYSKKRWYAELGLRYDVRNQSRYINQNNQVLSNDLSYQNISFAAGLSYQLNSEWKLSSNASSAWRPPGINELYADGLHAALATYEKGNANLQAERSYNFEMGIKHQNEKWQAEFNLFRNYMDNYIYRLPTKTIVTNFRGSFPLFEWSQTNAVIYGSELLFNYSINKNFLASLNASFLYADDISYARPLIFIPANRSKLSLNYEKDAIGKIQKLFFTASYTFVSQQNRYPDSLDWTAPPAAYALFDINAGLQININKQPIKISLGIQNVFDVVYRDYLSRYRYFSLDPGRNLIVRIVVPFAILSKL
jgi:iron complex outermembrane receptor protein